MGVCFSWGWKIANRPRESWYREGQLFIFFSCFSSFRKEERASHHQNRGKETLPSMGWQRAHSHIIPHPKPSSPHPLSHPELLN